MLAFLHSRSHLSLISSVRGPILLWTLSIINAHMGAGGKSPQRSQVAELVRDICAREKIYLILVKSLLVVC